ncbi:MAG: hypothetical protein A4S09_17075 [Proteobacteria bacterium SG_bin7]|nr:MAG: hypothetical protein A4S09_17075 [Proteobacteria bacterium SG_bin7]
MKSEPKRKSKKNLSFHSKLERLADGMEYFAVSVPKKTSETLGTKGPVPITAQINGSEVFLASLYPVGDGGHKLRVKNKICKSVGITEGDKVKVEFSIRDRSKETIIPKDLEIALKEDDVLEDFKGIPEGKRSYLLRLIDGAVKEETRAKKIQDAVEQAHRRKDRNIAAKN